jgi:antitoxin FitA
MSLNLSIKNVPDMVVERLRERAERNRRSLQGELLAIVESVANEGERSTTAMKDLYEWARTQPFAGTGDAAAEVRQMRDARTELVGRPAASGVPTKPRKVPSARRRR